MVICLCVHNTNKITFVVTVSSSVVVIEVVRTDTKVVLSSKVVVSVEAPLVIICTVVVSVIASVVISDTIGENGSSVVGSVVIFSLEIVSLVTSLFTMVTEVSLTISSDDVVDDSASVECDIELVVE